MSGTISPFSGQYFAPQAQGSAVNMTNWRAALAAAQQQAAIQRAQLLQLQKQAAAQQAAMMKLGIPGPASGYQPGQALPLPGAIPIAGGGQGPMGNVTPGSDGMASVQGQVPFASGGVPMPDPRRFRGAPGGLNAPGGANPFSISPTGNQSLMEMAIRDYSQQLSNPFQTQPAGQAPQSSSGVPSADLQSVVSALQKVAPGGSSS